MLIIKTAIMVMIFAMMLLMTMMVGRIPKRLYRSRCVFWGSDIAVGQSSDH